MCLNVKENFYRVYTEILFHSLNINTDFSLVGIHLSDYILLTSQIIVIIRVELQVGTYEYEYLVSHPRRPKS
jgi:thiamine phosphate synthase YjbQ (UPF0047 family)